MRIWEPVRGKILRRCLDSLDAKPGLRRKDRRSSLVCVFGLTLLVAAGCSGDGLTTVPVRGKITFGGGPPPAEGAVFFAPLEVEPGFPRRPGRARFGVDGTYAATSFEQGDGLVPGTYRVSVECWQTPPGMGGSAGVSYVGASFDPPNLVVSEEQGPIEHDLEVPLAR
jgi:hypothetical protein